MIKGRRRIGKSRLAEEFAKDYTRFEEELKLLENNFSKVHDGLNQITTTRSNKLNLRFRQIKELQSGSTDSDSQSSLPS